MRNIAISEPLSEAAIDLLASARGKKFGTILADPPWQFQNRTAIPGTRYSFEQAVEIAVTAHELIARKAILFLRDLGVFLLRASA